jgi:hypothetical protein
VLLIESIARTQRGATRVFLRRHLRAAIFVQPAPGAAPLSALSRKGMK